MFQFAAYRIMSSRRHALRVAVQTAVATLAVHLLMRPLAPDLESWAAVLSNSLAAIWPGLTYAAVMAAIVALDPSPDGRSALA
ncbi:hypothetical protein RG959_24255, partial [Domibacillus sp. 8LH]